MLLSRFCGWADCDVLAQMMLYYEWTCTRPRQLFSVGHNCKGNARVCRCVCVCVCVYVCVRVCLCVQCRPTQKCCRNPGTIAPASALLKKPGASPSLPHQSSRKIQAFLLLRPGSLHSNVAMSMHVRMRLACKSRVHAARARRHSCRTLPGALASTSVQTPTCGHCAYQDKACGRGVEDGRLGHPSRKRQDSVHGNKQPDCTRGPLHSQYSHGRVKSWSGGALDREQEQESGERRGHRRAVQPSARETAHLQPSRPLLLSRATTTAQTVS